MCIESVAQCCQQYAPEERVIAEDYCNNLRYAFLYGDSATLENPGIPAQRPLYLRDRCHYQATRREQPFQVELLQPEPALRLKDTAEIVGFGYDYEPDIVTPNPNLMWYQIGRNK